MRPTFYVATSFTNRNQAREVAQRLQQMGLRWAYNHDWTKFEVAAPNDPQTKLTMLFDLQAAVGADLFVLLLASPLTVGCHVELGARIGVNKEAHIVLQGIDAWHPFHDHPGIVKHKTFEDLLRFIF